MKESFAELQVLEQPTKAEGVAIELLLGTIEPAGKKKLPKIDV